MLTHVVRRAYPFIPLILVLAGCQDATAPRAGMASAGFKPRLAQGVGGVWTVNSLADPGSGTCDDTECTLRDAIAAATDGDKIVFASGLEGDIKTTVGEIVINGRDLTVDGDGRIAVDGQGANRAFTVGLATVTLKGLTFKNGSSSPGQGGGGGIFVSIADVTLDGVTVTNNKSADSGGGLSLYSSTVRILNSTISGNSADDYGGAIAQRGGTTTITASTISGNTSFEGAVHNEAGSMTIRSGAIVKNVVTDHFAGGTISVMSTSVGPATTSLANTIVGGNDSRGECVTAVNGGSNNADIISLGHNLSSGCPGGATGDVTMTAGQIFTQVLEETLSDNGGPTKTHALLARGLAEDAGYCPGESADQRGLTRPVDNPAAPNATTGGCDIGPYELQGSVAANADLLISQSVNKTSAKQGDLITYSIRVQNLGPQTAPNVVVNDVLSTGVTFYSASSNKGNFTAPPKGETGTVTWHLGDMLDQANEVAVIKVTVLVRGKATVTNSATVTSDVDDSNQANNSASITVSVASGSGGGGTGTGGGGGGGGGNPHR